MYITYKYDFWVIQILYRSNSYDTYDTRLEKNATLNRKFKTVEAAMSWLVLYDMSSLSSHSMISILYQSLWHYVGNRNVIKRLKCIE